MATKAEITALINANLASGSGITATEHREVLHTNANSILENIYGSIIEDTHTSQTITTANANFSYRIIVSKVGRFVTITGGFTCLNSVNLQSTIFVFSDTKYHTIDSETSSGFAQKFSNTDVVRVFMFPDRLVTSKTMIAGEAFGFSITYAVKD